MSIFEQLKRNKIPVAQTHVSDNANNELFFQLHFVGGGAYIEMTDENGRETEFDYRRFSGILRSITKNIQLAKDRNNFTIDWEIPITACTSMSTLISWRSCSRVIIL